MLIFKRVITASISFLILFLVFYFGAMIIGGGVAGVMASTQNPESIQITAEQAGDQFALKYFGIISLSALGLSATVAGILSFGGVFPWCKRKKHIPINQDNKTSPSVN